MEEIIRQVGDMTADDQLVRGVLTVGAAVLVVVAAGWRAMHGRPDRVRIDAPSDVEIMVTPRSPKS